MKHVPFVVIFIVAHIGLVFLEINKHMRFIKYSFDKQKVERQVAALVQKKELLTQELYALQDPCKINQFAQEVLHLQPIALYQIKRLPAADELITTKKPTNAKQRTNEIANHAGA